MNIVVINYNSGNLASLTNSLNSVVKKNRKSFNVSITNEPEKVMKADKVILPGVGDFSNCKSQLLSILGMKEALKRADAYENAGADAILIHSKQKNADEIFEFADSWKGNVPLIAIPTTYDNVEISKLYEHNIKMVIYANQTLRVSYTAMNNLLNDMIKAEKISDVEEEMATMKDIFQLQEMYDIKTKEKNLEAELKKLGYIS